MKKTQLAIDAKSAREVNEYLTKGWRVVFMSPQGITGQPSTPGDIAHGWFLIILEKEAN